MPSRKRKRDGKDDGDGALRDLLTHWPRTNLSGYQRELAAAMRARFVQKSVASLERLTEELELSSPFASLMDRAAQRACGGIPAMGRQLLSLLWSALALYQDVSLVHTLWDGYYRLVRVVGQFVQYFPEARNARILGREMRRWNAFLVQAPLFMHMTEWLCNQHEVLPQEEGDLRRGEQMLLDLLELWYASPLRWKCTHRAPHGSSGCRERACRACATHHLHILRTLGNLVRYPWCDLERVIPLMEMWLKQVQQPELRDLRDLHRGIVEHAARAPHDLAAQVWLLHALLQLPVEVRKDCAQQARTHLVILSEVANFMPVDGSAGHVGSGMPSMSMMLVDMGLEALAPHLARVHAEDVPLLARVANQCAYLAWRYPQSVRRVQLDALLRLARAALPCAFDAAVQQAPNYRACHWAGIDARLADKPPSPPRPTRFLCALTCELMQNPIKLPQSGEILDASSLARHLAVSQTDPYTLTPLTMAQVEPQDSLRKEIEASRALPPPQ